MDKLIWEIIEKSKDGKIYCPSEVQFSNLSRILSTYEVEVSQQLLDYFWDLKRIMINNDEFEKLHETNGGIIFGGDDAFYTDFASWIMVQGYDLYRGFLAKGHTAILKYIGDNDISENDYTYECMEYAFPQIPIVETSVEDVGTDTDEVNEITISLELDFPINNQIFKGKNNT